MRKIKIAMIGTGHDHAGPTANSLLHNSDIFDFVGYSTVPEDAYNLDGYVFKGSPDVKEMTTEEILAYPDLDAVCIECEDRALTKYAIMAAERGLHIHMDKPGGVDDKEFDRLIDIVKEKNLVFQTGYMYRYNPAVIKLKEDIANGKLGEVYAVEAQMNCIHKQIKREWLGAYPGGMLYFLGCHLVDLVYSIMGEPEEVIPLSTAVGHDGIDAEDFGMAVLKYKNGVSFVKSTAVEIGGFARRQLVVCGTRGTVEIKPLERIGIECEGMYAAQNTDVREDFTDGANWGYEGERTTSVTHPRYCTMLCEFAAYVRGDKNNPYTYEYERGLHKLILRSCGYKEKK